MCQYSSRCPTGRHRPGTQCPYAGRDGWSRPPSPPRPAGLSSTSRTTQAGRPAATGEYLSGSRYGRTAAADGISLLDLLAAVIVAKSWERFHAALGWWGVLAAVLLVVLPFAGAALLSRHCTAWNSIAEGRCARVRARPFQRCQEVTHGYAAQVLTAHEVGALLCFLAGLAALWALLTG